MAPECLLIIAKLREKLASLRIHLSLRGPSVFHTEDCIDNEACSNAWDNAWLTNVGRKFLHPEDIWRPTYSEVKACAESLTVPDMTPTCFTAVSSEVRNTAGWDFEAKAVAKAVELLMIPEIELTLPLLSDEMEVMIE